MGSVGNSIPGSRGTVSSVSKGDEQRFKVGTPPWPQELLTVWEELQSEEGQRRTFQSAGAEGRGAKAV